MQSSIKNRPSFRGPVHFRLYLQFQGFLSQISSGSGIGGSALTTVAAAAVSSRVAKNAHSKRVIRYFPSFVVVM